MSNLEQRISRRENLKQSMILNTELQHYRGIPIRLIDRSSYNSMKAKRYTINNTNQNIWIPNKHLLEDGTIKENENIDYIFRKAYNQLTIAGITHAIPGIKRRSDVVIS